jgi:hypothetical protein
MTGGETAFLQKLEYRVGQVQKPQGIGDGGAGFSHAQGNVFLGHVVLIHQDLVALGLFDGVQIFPLEVFNLHDLSVVGFNDHGGDLLQPGGLCGAPTPLSGNDLIVAGAEPSDGEGLDHTVSADRVGQIAEGLFVKPLPGLVQPRLDLRDGKGKGALALLLILKHGALT